MRGCATWSSSCRTSSARPPPRANARRPNGSSRASPSSASKRGSRRSGCTASTGGRSRCSRGLPRSPGSRPGAAADGRRRRRRCRCRHDLGRPHGRPATHFAARSRAARAWNVVAETGPARRAPHGGPGRPPRRRPSGPAVPPRHPGLRLEALAGADRAKRHQPAGDVSGVRRPGDGGLGSAPAAGRRCAGSGRRVAAGRPGRCWPTSACDGWSRAPTTTLRGVVALLELARRLAERPLADTRVMFVSTSEESILEGMQAFARRHFPSLPRARHLLPQSRHARIPAPDGPARRGHA